MGGHLLFLVDFIIAQNVEKVKFWKGGEGSRGGEKQNKIEIFQFGALTGCIDKKIQTMSSINEEYNKMEQENKK